MRGQRQSFRRVTVLFWLLLVPPSLWVVAGCSEGGKGGSATSSSARSSGGGGSLPAGAIGVSPGGVTTRVDAPAESTEEEYFQACHAAKEWMDGQGSTGEALIEPYLKMVQAAGSGVAGSWNQRWADLSPARQAAVIVAAQAAANQQCG
ncbi:lipoprotein LpqV [Mycobacterium asiaticum]|uniref:lipoprotein LpqV n=1 Tax=Mycobacterium asiaticum TaxID=1790 RepID=UPI000A9E1B69